MAQLIRRSGWWYSDFRKDGKRIRQRLSPHKERAKEMLKDLLEVKASEKNGTAPKSVSWFYFLEKYLPHRKARVNASTYGNDERAFAMVKEYGRPILRLEQMTPEYLDDLWTKCKVHDTKPLSDRTISGYVRRLKTAMHQARHWGLAPMQDWGSVKCLADGKRKDYLTFAEFEAVVDEAEGPYKRAAMLMGWAGLRRGEVLHLEWSDVDFKNHLIKIQVKADWKPKGSTDQNSKERVVDMTEKLEAYLQGLPERMGLVLGEAINEDVFSKTFRKLGRRLKLKLFPHKFRHTCASFLISTGSTPEEVGALFGQSDVRSTKVYTHMMPHARRNAVDRMQKGMEGLGQNGASL